MGPQETGHRCRRAVSLAPGPGPTKSQGMGSGHQEHPDFQMPPSTSRIKYFGVRHGNMQLFSRYLDEYDKVCLRTSVRIIRIDEWMKEGKRGREARKEKWMDEWMDGG